MHYRFNNNGWPQVFCRQLGYPDAEASIYAKEKNASYDSSNPIGFHSPACNTKTADLMTDCAQDSNPTCDNTKDVYVTCSGNVI